MVIPLPVNQIFRYQRDSGPVFLIREIHDSAANDLSLTRTVCEARIKP